MDDNSIEKKLSGLEEAFQPKTESDNNAKNEVNKIVDRILFDVGTEQKEEDNNMNEFQNETLEDMKDIMDQNEVEEMTLFDEESFEEVVEPKVTSVQKNMEDKVETSFENALLELEEIVKELEGGNVPLEEAISKFNNGMVLSKICHDKLQNAENSINNIVQNGRIQVINDTNE